TKPYRALSDRTSYSALMTVNRKTGSLQSGLRWRTFGPLAGAWPHHRSKAPMTDYSIEDLRYSVKNFSEGRNPLEGLATLHDVDAAQAAYEACRAKYPKRLLFLCQGGRILRRSDRDVAEVRAL